MDVSNAMKLAIHHFCNIIYSDSRLSSLADYGRVDVCALRTIIKSNAMMKNIDIRSYACAILLRPE